MPKNDYAVVVSGLKKSYGRNHVLKGVNLKVKRGTMLALLGPNGAGKTTTVRILSTLLPFDDGTVTIEGFDVKNQADEVRSVIGLTGQSAAVDELLLDVVLGHADHVQEERRNGLDTVLVGVGVVHLDLGDHGVGLTASWHQFSCLIAPAAMPARLKSALRSLPSNSL